jgi:hypothetical protein
MRRLAEQCCLAFALVLTGAVAAGDDLAGAPSWPTEEFHFVRMYYDGGGGGRWGRSGWTTDYPDAEYHFTMGVRRLSRVNIGEQARMFQVTDDAIFDYPWLYAVEVGSWYLNDTEAARLREYLLRGGFLMTDDFHGQNEWFAFTDSMSRVFPDRPIVDIEDSHEILRVVYEVDERIQVPGLVSILNNTTFENGGRVPHWRGIYDDDGRLMVIINHNMDLGDAWEHADDTRYPQEMTTLALHFAVNYVIFSMTH